MQVKRPSGERGVNRYENLTGVKIARLYDPLTFSKESNT